MRSSEPIAAGGRFKDAAFQKAFRAYTQRPLFLAPTWVRDLPFEPHSDRGLALLVVAAALRGLIPDSRLGPALLSLWERFGLDLFRLSRLPFATASEWVASEENLPDHPSQKIPGVLRSCADFFFATGSLNQWLKSADSGEAVVRQLADSIFWMGKSSPYRNKPRYWLWLLHATQYPDTRLFETAMPPVTPSHFRWISSFGDVRMRKHVYSLPASGRLRYIADCIEMTGSNPWHALPALSAFLERAGTQGFRCQDKTEGCPSCALKVFCPVGKTLGQKRENR